VSEDQIKMLFAKVSEVLESVEEIKKVVNRTAAEWRGVVNVIEDHGNEIAQIRLVIDKLQLRCPMLKTKTDEFSKVNCDD